MSMETPYVVVRHLNDSQVDTLCQAIPLAFDHLGSVTVIPEHNGIHHKSMTKMVIIQTRHEKATTYTIQHMDFTAIFTGIHFGNKTSTADHLLRRMLGKISLVEMLNEIPGVYNLVVLNHNSMFNALQTLCLRHHGDTEPIYTSSTKHGNLVVSPNLMAMRAVFNILGHNDSMMAYEVAPGMIHDSQSQTSTPLLIDFAPKHMQLTNDTFKQLVLSRIAAVDNMKYMLLDSILSLHVADLLGKCSTGNPLKTIELVHDEAISHADHQLQFDVTDVIAQLYAIKHTVCGGEALVAEIVCRIVESKMHLSVVACFDVPTRSNSGYFTDQGKPLETSKTLSAAQRGNFCVRGTCFVNPLYSDNILSVGLDQAIMFDNVYPNRTRIKIMELLFDHFNVSSLIDLANAFNSFVLMSANARLCSNIFYSLEV